MPIVLSDQPSTTFLLSDIVTIFASLIFGNMYNARHTTSFLIPIVRSVFRSQHIFTSLIFENIIPAHTAIQLPFLLSDRFFYRKKFRVAYFRKYNASDTTSIASILSSDWFSDRNNFLVAYFWKYNTSHPPLPIGSFRS